MSQMTHMGRRGTSTISGIPLRAPSDLPEGVHLEVPVPLATCGDPGDRARASRTRRERLERCGWDGCEVTSFGGHLIEQFFDPRDQHAHGRVRRQPREPHALRARGAGGRARRGLGVVHRRVPDGGRPVPDRRPRPGRADRDRAQPRVDRRDRPVQRQRRHGRDAAVDRLLRARRTSCRRASTTSARGGSARRSACRSLVAGRNVEPAMAEDGASPAASTSSR